MNSSVKQAQKEGASIEDIAAGLCYYRGAQRPVQGHQAARFRRTRRHCGGPGRYVPQRRRAARVRTAHRTRSHPTEHRRPHGRVRRGPSPPACTTRTSRTTDNAHVGADGRSVDAAAAEESAAGDEPNAAAHAGEIVVDGVRHTPSRQSSHGEALNEMSMTTERDVCKLCQNHCKLTITTFSPTAPAS